VRGNDIELKVASGTLTATAWGDPADPLVVCVPGLSQDQHCFDFLAPRLASGGRYVVAVSLRGRGNSSVTPSGTYGWAAHAADLAEVVPALGRASADVVGWSFGCVVSMQLTADAPGVVSRLALIDGVGRPDADTLAPVLAGLERLDAVYDSPADYVQRSLAGGAMAGCEDTFRAYLPGDVVAVDGGYATRTNKAAVVEDAMDGSRRDPYALWPALTMPVLLLRAAEPILPGLGFIVTCADAERFPGEVSGASVVEIPANHYCIGMRPETADAIAAFLADTQLAG
jgi:pimeloyl-ACP methyl ester carboxylesterase